jgi:hypothetical protein
MNHFHFLHAIGWGDRVIFAVCAFAAVCVLASVVISKEDK